MASKTPPIIVLSGPSGSGKTTLCRMAADRLGLTYIVSHTTRPPRPNEKKGYDYHFVDRMIFQKSIDDGDFLEYASVYGNYYGTSKKRVTDLIQKGEGVILDLDVQGALNIRKIFPQAILVFVKAPSPTHLEKRLFQRGTEDPENRQKRLEQAKKEELSQKNYDAVLVNDSLETTYQELERLITDAQGR